MKKKTLFHTLVFAFLLWGGCSTDKQEPTDGLCHIHGTANPRLNGIRIFLIPLNTPAIAETVDSVVITDGRFEFTSEPSEMKSIRLDYRHRSGVEELLVVTEPGILQVTIDSISYSKGTPQNDSLQQWKEYTMQHYRKLTPLHHRKREAKKNGNSAAVQILKQQQDSLIRDYKRYTRSLAASLKEGPLRDFLNSRFPISYKKRMPDGSIQTVQAEE